MKNVVPINQFRKRAKMSIAALSRAAGVSYKTASHWDAGRRDPSLGNLAKLIEIFEKAGIETAVADFLPKRRAA